MPRVPHVAVYRDGVAYASKLTQPGCAGMLASLARHQPHSYADIYKRSHHLKSLQPAVIRRGVRAFAAATARAATLYELLGVKPSSSLEDIKTGYRKAVIQLHPDVNPGAEAQFKAVLLAYQVLSDDGLREKYDSLGVAGLGEDYADLKQHVADGGSGGYAGAPSSGADLSTVLGLELREALAGSHATITTEAAAPCSSCQGTGYEPEARPLICQVCRGSGDILCNKWRPGDQPRVVELQRCPACRGSGWQGRAQCRRCLSSGLQRVRRKVRLKVPAGAHDGQVLRLQGMGDAGPYGGAPGDLFVKLQVYNLSQDMVRRGCDLFSPLVVPLYDALLGGSLPVTTTRGQRLLTVPPGTQEGAQLCLPGAGVAKTNTLGQGDMKSLEQQYGSHFFTVSIRVPSGEAATPAEQEVMTQLAQVYRRSRSGSTGALAS